MRRLAPSLSLGLISLAAIVAIRCGGDSATGPTEPTNRDAAPVALNLDLDSIADTDSAEAPDVSAFALAAARLGDRGRASSAGDVASLSTAADWFLDVIRAPKQSSTFKVNKDGMNPQPAPKFRFRVKAPVNVPESVILVFFLTAGGKECGVATTPRPFALTANVSRNIDIPNDYILVGPNGCFLDGQNCTPSQCKFPLNTTKMRIIFGNKDQGAAQGTSSYKYKWSTATGGGGNPNPNPNPNPTPNPGPPPSNNSCSAPSNVPCGKPSAVCNDGSYSCSKNASGTCSSHGGVGCWVCPGPLCH